MSPVFKAWVEMGVVLRKEMFLFDVVVVEGVMENCTLAVDHTAFSKRDFSVFRSCAAVALTGCGCSGCSTHCPVITKVFLPCLTFHFFFCLFQCSSSLLETSTSASSTFLFQKEMKKETRKTQASNEMVHFSNPTRELLLRRHAEEVFCRGAVGGTKPAACGRAGPLDEADAARAG